MCADQVVAHGEQRANTALALGRAVRGPIRAEAAGVHECLRVAPVGLHALTASGAHGRKVGVRYDDLVPELFEHTGDPLALG